MNSTKYFAFGGLDGSGKTTQIERIAHLFNTWGYSTTIFRHFDTTIGRKSLELLSLSKDAYIRSLVFAIDEYAQKIELQKEITECDIVLFDRSHFCACAYSGAQGLSQQWIETLYKYSISYDKCIYLDISASLSLERKGLDSVSPALTCSQYENVRKIYLDLVAQDKMQLVDASQELDVVTQEIINIMKKVIST